MNETQQAPDTGAEDLNHLAREADMLDAAPERQAQEVAQAETAERVQGTEAELLGALKALRAMVFPMLAMAVHQRKVDALARVWNDGVLGQSAAAGAAVMERHGWSLAGAFDTYGPYIMLVAAVAPPVMTTRAILAEPDPKPSADAEQQKPA